MEDNMEDAEDFESFTRCQYSLP